MVNTNENPNPSEEEEIKYEKISEEEFGEFLANFSTRIARSERVSKYIHHIFSSALTVLLLIAAVQVGIAQVSPILTLLISLALPSFIIYVFDQTGDAVTHWVMKKLAFLRLKFDLIKQRNKKEDDNSDSDRTDSN